MRKMTGIVASMLVLLTLAGFATGAAAQTAAGALRIVQVSPDTPAVDIVVNGKKTVSNLKYQNVTDYMNLAGGSYDIKVYATGTNTPAIDLPNFNVSDGSLNTLVIAGLSKDKSLTAVQLSDNNWIATSGKSKVRFIHGSPDTAAVDVNVSGLGDVFKNISFKSSGRYIEIEPGAVTFQAKLVSSNQVILTKDLNFEAGKVYTVYATGLASAGTVGVVVSIDNSLPTAMPATGLGGAANSNAPAFDWVLAILIISAGGAGAFISRRTGRKSHN